ncbi:MAG TPA: TetR/AcrR family transcriptional regulator [Vicinamibacterales bacterium]|nr:TetR/AcrR family transcriptional regulator [Vicinamibacterales bacterium]
MKSSRRQGYTMVARAEGMVATRDRIVQAALALALEQAYEDITLAAIAEAADVSHQTVLNHFASKEKVAVAAAELLSRQTIDARARAMPGDLTGAISILVGEYERLGDANARWAAAAERLGSLAAMLEGARASHQVWLEHIFSERLPTRHSARRHAIHALHAATDVYTWKLLRRDLRLSRETTERIMLDLANGALDRISDRTPRRRSRRRKP